MHVCVCVKRGRDFVEGGGEIPSRGLGEISSGLCGDFFCWGRGGGGCHHGGWGLFKCTVKPL